MTLFPLNVVFIIFQLIFPTTDGRLVELRGNSFARGKLLGEILQKNITALFVKKQSQYGDKFKEFEAYAAHVKPLIAEFAPTTYQELLGLDSVLSPQVDIWFLASEYDCYMNLQNLKKSGDKCTGFASNRNLDDPISGQNNDENPLYWIPDSQTVLRHIDEDASFHTLIYTHPGVPAYMGINSKGLQILWQYIDNGERKRESVPTCVILRELLTYSSAAEAISWLKNIPIGVPNNFILTDSSAIYNLEISPSSITISVFINGYTSHTNHVIKDDRMQDHDVSLNTSSTTVQRYEQVRKSMKKYDGNISKAQGKFILSQDWIYNKHTLASLILEKNEMNIRFYNESNWQTFEVVPSSIEE